MLKRIYETANKLAESLLNHQRGIVFYMDDKKMRAVWWHNVNAESLTLDENASFLQDFEMGFSRVLALDEQKTRELGLAGVMERMGFKAALAAPLVVNGKIKGVWFLSWPQPRVFSENDVLIMETLAANLGLNIQSIIIGSENLKLRRETKAIYEINREISRLSDIDLTMDNIVEKACLLLHASSCYIALADEESRTLQIRANYTTRGEAWRIWAFKYHPGECRNTRSDGYIMHWQNLTYLYGEGVGGLTAQESNSHLINSFRQYTAEINICVPEILATGGIASSICVPMCTKRGLVGILCAVSSKDNAFSRAQLKIMETMGNQAAIAIENSYYYSEQKRLTAKLRTSITTHGRLLELVFANQGMQAVCDTLSELIESPVVLQGKDCQIMHWSTKGFNNFGFDKLKKILNCCSSEEAVPAGNDVRTFDDMIALPTGDCTGINRVVAPVVGGKSKFGYVSAFAVDKKLNEQQRIALEEASIVFALEFLRQEAARAGLLQHVITAQEEERKRIARELHDETSQALTALMLGLDTMALEMSPEKVPPCLYATKALAESMLDNIHRIMSDLRPSVLDDLGLVSAITWFGEQRLTPLGIEYSLQTDGLQERLSPPLETALYRIVQEALTNVIRHAQAQTVDIVLRKNGNSLTLEVRDDGSGFNPDIFKKTGDSSQCLGLWGMQERVHALDGKMTIDTEINQGTAITIHVPL